MSKFLFTAFSFNCHVSTTSFMFCNITYIHSDSDCFLFLTNFTLFVKLFCNTVCIFWVCWCNNLKCYVNSLWSSSLSCDLHCEDRCLFGYTLPFYDWAPMFMLRHISGFTNSDGIFVLELLALCIFSWSLLLCYTDYVTFCNLIIVYNNALNSVLLSGLLIRYLC